MLSEASPIDLSSSSTVQTLDTDAKEFFFGGGTQNGRFTHKGKTIKIANTNNWVDGGVASPNPFYWSSDGYGVLRNTFKPGAYDFGEADASQVKLSTRKMSLMPTIFFRMVLRAQRSLRMFSTATSMLPATRCFCRSTPSIWDI